MAWLTKVGPFWDDVRRHGTDDYLEGHGDVVTDSAVGEAAYRTLHEVKCGLVSFSPSDWNCSPVEVVWRREAEGLEDRKATILNWRTVADLEHDLAGTDTPVGSWVELSAICVRRFTRLQFSEDSFTPMAGIPYSKSSAARIVFLLSVLAQRARAFDVTGAPTKEAYRLHKDYFSGDSIFSPSSDREIQYFRERLTFRHPDNPNEQIVCGWHGKERHLTLRLHFSWPIKFKKPVYVVYVGPKLTKR